MDRGGRASPDERAAAPGPNLAILGLARPSRLSDLPSELAGLAVPRTLRLTRTVWEQPSPTVWPPPVTYQQMRQVSVRLLPGAQFRRLVMWPYAIIWSKPAAESGPTAHARQAVRSPPFAIVGDLVDQLRAAYLDQPVDPLDVEVLDPAPVATAGATTFRRVFIHGLQAADDSCHSGFIRKPRR